MNLFVLSLDHKTNARYHVDKHVIKMGLEATQLLSTIAKERCGIDVGYKSTYVNHSVTQWVGTSLDNFLWTTLYAGALFQEYTYRFERIHKSEAVLNGIGLHLEAISEILPDIGPTPHHLAVSPELKHLEPVLAYRAYYLKNKKRLFKWTKRQVPPWIVDPQYEIREYI
jgi:hypothetical protein